MSYILDLHTHSYGSADGGLRLEEYRSVLQRGLLDYIAITDHNSIQTAVAIKTGLAEFGRHIIVGEEIMTTKGEIIGLFLTQVVAAGLTPHQTTQQIHAQGGLVYVPHPFETVRSGLPAAALNEIADEVDIIETYNGRALLQNRSQTAMLWARQNSKPGAASSDAHGQIGWAKTYTITNHVPDRENLVRILGAGTYRQSNVGWGILYPKFNRLKKALGAS